MEDRFDAVVVGAGPGGEVVTDRLAKRGFKTALIERELIGGECAYWACIPSKTLLRPPEVRSEAKRAPGTSTPEHDFQQISAYRDYMIRNLDDGNQVKGYEQDGVRVFKGQATLTGPGRIEVDGEPVTYERLIIATGSEAQIPPISGLQETGYWTNREATTIREIPRSAIVLGGGPVGIELAQMLRRFGSSVQLVESADRLLAREDPRVSELTLDALRDEDIGVHLGAAVASVQRRNGDRVAHLGDGREIAARELIVATGRRPRVDGLGLETVGIQTEGAGIVIDERCRAAEGIWAVGDVTGVMPFTHVAKYQARVAVRDISGERVAADYAAVPRVVFSDPELAAVGLTEEQARERGIDAVTSHLVLPDVISRPWTYELDARGELAVIADRERKVLIGAWAVAPLAGEWIHYAALAVKAKIPLDVLRDSIAQFPTYTEGYLKAIERLGL
jgi:dihydrolipoamide dehydrogenase